MLDIIYRDNDLIAINKPHGLLVHKTWIAADADEFALQMLRDQINAPVYPTHRLDRKTSGVLLFALNKEADKAMQSMFANRLTTKKYWAIVRGFTPESLTIDYALTNEQRGVQEAITHFKTLAHSEIDLPSGKHATSRYSLVEANPETGRMHQIRKHFAHIFHPILGDRPHGCNKQNKLWLEAYQMNTMMLHAAALGFKHPFTEKEIIIEASVQAEFERVMQILQLPMTLLNRQNTSQ